MLSKRLLGLVFAGAMAVSTYAVDVVVKVAPPATVVETRGIAPGVGYVWIPGYHRWDGAHYVWVGGRWEMPPHPHDRWVAHRWVKRSAVTSLSKAIGADAPTLVVAQGESENEA
jgi:hypothetical protein